MPTPLAIAIELQMQAAAALKELEGDLKNIDSAGATASKGLKAADDAATNAGKSAKESSGHFGGLTSSFGSFSKLIGGFAVGSELTKLPGLFKGLMDGAAEDEAATARLSQTLKNLGGDVEGNTKAVNDRIAAGQKLGFSDDEIRDSFGFLAEATDSSGEALSRQTIAMDFARGAHISLQDASKLLGKTSDENTKTLKKYGIEVADGATATDVLASVQTRFAGQSQAFADSTAGKWAQFKIRMSEAGESVGYVLLPMMTKLGDIMLGKVAPALEKGVAIVGDIIQYFKDASSTGDALNDSLANIPGPLQAIAKYGAEAFLWVKAVAPDAIEKVRDAMVTTFDYLSSHTEIVKAAGVGIATVLVVAFTAWAVSAGLAAAATLLAAAPVIALGLVIAGLGAGIFLLITHWDDITAKYPAVGAAFDAVKAAVQAAADFVIEHWPQVQAVLEAVGSWITGTLLPIFVSISTTVGSAIGAAVGFVVDHWPQIQATIETLTSWLATVFSVAFGLLSDYVITPVNLAVLFVEDHWGQIQTAIEAVLTFLEGTFKVGFAVVKDYIVNPIEEAIGWVVSNVSRVTKPLQEIIDKIQDVIRWFDKIPSMPSIPGFGSNDPASNGLKDDWGIGHAAGGTNLPGGLAMVGERGPELMVLPGGTTIIPNHLLDQLPHFANGGTMPLTNGGANSGEDAAYYSGLYAWQHGLPVAPEWISAYAATAGPRGIYAGGVAWDGTGSPPAGPWYGTGKALGQSGQGGSPNHGSGWNGMPGWNGTPDIGTAQGPPDNRGGWVRNPPPMGDGHPFWSADYSSWAPENQGGQGAFPRFTYSNPTAVPHIQQHGLVPYSLIDHAMSNDGGAGYRATGQMDDRGQLAGVAAAQIAAWQRAASGGYGQDDSQWAAAHQWSDDGLTAEQRQAREIANSMPGLAELAAAQDRDPAHAVKGYGRGGGGGGTQHLPPTEGPQPPIVAPRTNSYVESGTGGRGASAGAGGGIHLHFHFPNTLVVDGQVIRGAMNIAAPYIADALARRATRTVA